MAEREVLADTGSPLPRVSPADVSFKVGGGNIPVRQWDSSVGSIKKALRLSSTSSRPHSSSSSSSKRTAAAAPARCIDVVRNKAERAVLPGYSCLQCEKYIAVMREQGLLQSEDDVTEMLQNCSRHKSAAGPPPDTPEGFWDLTVHTPEEWKNKAMPPPHYMH
jgi:hypothetical protein